MCINHDWIMHVVIPWVNKNDKKTISIEIK